MNVNSSTGERVRRLRVALGLGQVELADRVGLASGAVSMLENGRLTVDDALLLSLAKVLDCSPSYLDVPSPELIATKPQLRAYADAPSRFVDRTIADSVTAIELAQQLTLTMLPDILPLFDGDLNDDDAIEGFAGEVRAQAGLEHGDVVRNSIRAAERLGCIVLPLESELGRHLGLSLRVDGRPVIRVSRPSVDPEQNVPGDRQRFTVAHELGHLVLHQASPPPNSAVEATRVEKQAHRFAAAFLAPADAILADLESHGGRVTLSTLAQLKEVWGVSIKALVVRFQNLGIIGDDQARSLYKQISARRWNKFEPVPVGNESAVWFSKSLEKRLHGAERVIDAAAAATGLGTSYLVRWTDWTPVGSGEPNGEVVSFDRSRIRDAGRAVSTTANISRMPVRPR